MNIDLQICTGAPPAPGAAFAPASSVQLAGLRPGPTLAEWAMMVVAMMVPLIAPDTGQMAARVWPRSRARVIAAFNGSYIGLWLLAGPAVMGATLAARAAPAPGAGALATSIPALALAAVWMISPLRRRLLARGHFRPVLAPGGSRAVRGAARAGARKAAFCMLTCLPLMLAMQIAGGGLAGMALVFVMLIAERRTRRPVPQGAALLLLVFGFYLALR